GAAVLYAMRETDHQDRKRDVERNCMTPSETVTPHVRRVDATRFVLPLREGGSVPGLFEPDDDGLYVVKFHGAAQGPKTLTAELIAGEIGRALGLRVPE